jgi:hypothetical protein
MHSLFCLKSFHRRNSHHFIILIFPPLLWAFPYYVQTKRMHLEPAKPAAPCKSLSVNKGKEREHVAKKRASPAISRRISRRIDQMQFCGRSSYGCTCICTCQQEDLIEMREMRWTQWLLAARCFLCL